RWWWRRRPHRDVVELHAERPRDAAGELDAAAVTYSRPTMPAAGTNAVAFTFISGSNVCSTPASIEIATWRLSSYSKPAAPRIETRAPLDSKTGSPADMYGRYVCGRIATTPPT